jgi:prepilin-type N-terminal cleavage/methylation domain-containing protein
MKMFRKDEGFTLVELMVVVLIIGILVAIAIPVFNSAKANAQKKACWANQRTIEGTGRSMEASTGVLPAAVADMVTAGFMQTAPKCPTDATSLYTYSGGAAGTGLAGCGYSTPHPHF